MQSHTATGDFLLKTENTSMWSEITIAAVIARAQVKEVEAWGNLKHFPFQFSSLGKKHTSCSPKLVDKSLPWSPELVQLGGSNQLFDISPCDSCKTFSWALAVAFERQFIIGMCSAVNNAIPLASSSLILMTFFVSFKVVSREPKFGVLVELGKQSSIIRKVVRQVWSKHSNPIKLKCKFKNLR